jgi:predicted small lipoprotein YifL
MRRIVIILLATMALAGCGKRQPLQPAAGKALPMKPATSATQPNSTQLLASPPQMRPGRSDELLTKSQTRADDHFDLPPR